ncbi:hypothetical protein C900_00203 [Fulvivirga imtechensis AK7]|uniref:Uncharacterized protein n=2 Tax=Fulvivirga TaxID=396811 RepID=L8JIH0_9BACT|nr:hypothetical protein C900_00203 [Fulvivirga imtechensis AK7]
MDIEIVKSDLLEKIKNDSNPILKIEFEGNYIYAKGNNIFKSSVPKGCDYFYPLDNNDKVVINDKQVIKLRKVE